jgi:ArsR family transcriptional regulator
MAEASSHQSPDQSDLDPVIRLGKAVGDQLRATIIALLKADSLSVSELCAVLDIAQPALSHHLKVLLRSGLLARRREGTSLFYRRDDNAQDPLKQAIFSAIDQIPLSSALSRGLESVHQRRREHCQAFFAQRATEIASLQTQIAEPAAYNDTVLEMTARLPGAALALEVGPGTGGLLTSLASRYQSVFGIDSSEAMLAQTQRLAREAANVTLLHGDFLTLDFEPQLDLIVAAMTVHHLPSPAAFFARAAELLAPGGSIIIVELSRHDQHWTSEICGDLWLGFEPSELKRWAENAGLENCESQFLAQKNGFQIQVQRYVAARNSTLLQTNNLSRKDVT